MKALDLIHRVESLGVQLRSSGNVLRVDAPVGVVTPELKAQLRTHKAEIMAALSPLASSACKTRVYHVIVDTDGIPKSMTVIDPTGTDIESFRDSCFARFGDERVLSVELRT